MLRMGMTVGLLVCGCVEVIKLAVRGGTNTRHRTASSRCQERVHGRDYESGARPGQLAVADRVLLLPDCRAETGVWFTLQLFNRQREHNTVIAVDSGV